jgi:(5-formylfuran-3-yl)methyl phosphate synthase
MMDLKLSSDVPGLLVSVRNSSEALAALRGGADVIDVKEPSRGSLGAADRESIAAVVQTVGGQAIVSAACGELIDVVRMPNGDDQTLLPLGVSLFKIGLAGCAAVPDWSAVWQRAIEPIRASQASLEVRPVAVIYADWLAAGAPPPQEVLSAAMELGCPAILIDTWDKSQGALFNHWPLDDLQMFICEMRRQNLLVVLAGSLIGEGITAAAQLGPDLVAVRTAACDAGRSGTVSEQRVRNLKQMLDRTPRTTASV